MICLFLFKQNMLLLGLIMACNYLICSLTGSNCSEKIAHRANDSNKRKCQCDYCSVRLHRC